MKHVINMRSTKLTLNEAYSIFTGAKDYSFRDEIVDAAQVLLDEQRVFFSLCRDHQTLILLWLEQGLLFPPETYSITINNEYSIEAQPRELEN